MVSLRVHTTVKRGSSPWIRLTSCNDTKPCALRASLVTHSNEDAYIFPPALSSLQWRPTCQRMASSPLLLFRCRWFQPFFVVEMSLCVLQQAQEKVSANLLLQGVNGRESDFYASVCCSVTFPWNTHSVIFNEVAGSDISIAFCVNLLRTLLSHCVRNSLQQQKNIWRSSLWTLCRNCWSSASVQLAIRNTPGFWSHVPYTF